MQFSLLFKELEVKVEKDSCEKETVLPVCVEVDISVNSALKFDAVVIASPEALGSIIHEAKTRNLINKAMTVKKNCCRQPYGKGDISENAHSPRLHSSSHC